MQKPYDKLSKYQKQQLIDKAVQWLSIKPELIGDVKTDKEFLDRLAEFAKTLHEYFPEEDKSGSSVVSVPLGGI